MDFELSMATSNNVEWATELLKTCKRFGIDYYHGTPEEKFFCEEVAKKNYECSRALKEGKTLAAVAPFLGIKRATNAVI